ncbi:MAG: serine/threonine protein kinase [Myxococcales bacterium]|nr:serine/threonine protein kinase [Myxococcales bacterium]
MSSVTGATLGNWRIGRLLGEGAFGGVYEADHTTIAGRRGAVKILHKHLSMQADLKQRFLNEASAASRADHENIIQIFDAGVSPDGNCYMVMELLRGVTLTQLIKRGRLDGQRAARIGIQIAGALQTAHDLQIVHRDLKPDNIFIVARENNAEFVKVLDFGVCKLRGEVTGDAKLTSTGMIIGTSSYMSPEQWMSKTDIDGRADIYAQGIILFECLAGRQPFLADSPYELLRMHMDQAPPDLVPYGVPPRLNQAVQKMLAKEPNRRQSSMREVIRDLRLAVETPAQEPPQQRGSLAPTQVSQQRPVAPQPQYAARPEQPIAQPAQPAYVAQPQRAAHVAAAVGARFAQIAGDQQAKNGLLWKVVAGVVLATGGLIYAIFNWDSTISFLRSQLGV